MPSPGNPTSGAAQHPDGLPVPRRYWAIAAILLAICMSVLDSTITNVALPTIARDFGASAAASIWVISAYQLAILILLLPLASLGEIVGYRRVSQVGLAVFTLASLACACAPSLLTLSVARVIQGLGAAGIMSVNAALVRFTYPQRHLGRAIGINAFVVATSAALGPTIASAVLAVAHWRWLFGINIPLGIITITIASYSLPDSERTRRPLNYGGALLYAGTFGLLLSGLQSLAHDAATGFGLLQIAAAGALGWVLLRHELPRATPLIPFDLLRNRLFSLSVATSVCSFMAQMTALVALPFEIQRLGHSAVQTGLFMTPWPVGVAVAAPIAGRLADRYPRGCARRLRAAVVGGRAGTARIVPGERHRERLRVAHGLVWHRIRPLPVAQQSRHVVRRPARAHWRRRRHAGHGTTPWAESGRRRGCDPVSRSPAAGLKLRPVRSGVAGVHRRGGEHGAPDQR
jgi:DHA2 family multidrug resistance protein-like MFS transporter